MSVAALNGETRPNGRARAVATIAAILCALLLAGCITTDRSVALTEEIVTPLAVGDAAQISAADLAEAMLRAGFTREEILAEGPSVRNALATSGGARVRQGMVVAALFAVQGDQLIVTSRANGTFILVLR